MKHDKYQLQFLFNFFQLVKDGEVETHMGDLRNLIDETQDVVDVNSTIMKSDERLNNLYILFRRESKTLSKLVRKIRGIYGNISSIDINFSNLKVNDGQLQEYAVAGVRETNMVGFEDEVEILKRDLSEESKELDVVSIIGVPGLGKTTLARKIFRDPQIEDEFPNHIWVHVSQEFTMKHACHAILKELTSLSTDVINNKTDGELAKLVVGYLENINFLLVIDDLRTCEDWDELLIALPKSNKKGKVLITSHQEEVGWHVSRQRGPHMMRSLNEDESYMLLQLEVFHEPMFPPELEDEGKLIVDACNGLPLALVVVADTLINRFSGDMIAMGKYWENISKTFDIYDDDEDPKKRLEKIIFWSYEKFPDHLRDCFLYFGMFPEDFEIPVWKLIRLWIAEGFIQQKGVSSLEETAENYLVELINRNLVRAEKFKLNGKPKTCLIHGMLRDFCIKEAGTKGNEFLQKVKMSKQPLIPKTYDTRRLCVHSNILKFISLIPPSPSVRSFVCFSMAENEVIVPMENAEAIYEGFKLLRVLDVQPIRFTKFHISTSRFLHLTYLAMSVNLEILPPIIIRLENIQTLVIDTNSPTLKTEAYITNMLQLRHFKTNASATLHAANKGIKGAGGKIQTLGTITLESCTKDVFNKACNLKKLGIRGNLALLFDNKSGSFDSLRKLDNLEKLKLLHDAFHFPPAKVQLCHLPPPNKFPPKLKTLTLSETSLNWCHMSVLGSLEMLEVLKLKDNAFQGEMWEATDGGFRRLEVLHIGQTNLKIWLASHHHFPRLKHLQLNKCEDLKKLPVELANVPSFQKLDLFRSKQVAASAKEIEAKIEQDNLQPGNVVRRFRLSIFLHEK